MRKFFANSVSMKGPIKHSSLGKHQIANMVNSFNKFQKSYISDKIKLPSTLLEPYTTSKIRNIKIKSLSNNPILKIINPIVSNPKISNQTDSRFPDHPIKEIS